MVEFMDRATFPNARPQSEHLAPSFGYAPDHSITSWLVASLEILFSAHPRQITEDWFFNLCMGLSFLPDEAGLVNTAILAQRAHNMGTLTSIEAHHDFLERCGFVCGSGRSFGIHNRGTDLMNLDHEHGLLG